MGDDATLIDAARAAVAETLKAIALYASGTQLPAVSTDRLNKTAPQHLSTSAPQHPHLSTIKL
jgi:hypothetical protein